MKRTATLEFTLNEIEVLLLIFRPRELQELGKFADSARAKLNAARIELLADAPAEVEQTGLF